MQRNTEPRHGNIRHIPKLDRSQANDHYELSQAIYSGHLSGSMKYRSTLWDYR